MATVIRENIGTLHDKIIVKLTKEDYWPSFEQSLKKYAKSANIPGFRKGMVPAGMIRKMYGTSLFGDEVIRSASQELQKFLQEQKISIFAQPLPEVGASPLHFDIEDPGSYDLAFEIGLKPEIDILPLNNGTTFVKYHIPITEEMVTNETERVLKSQGTTEDQESVASAEDIIYGLYEPSNENGTVAEGTTPIEDRVLFSKIPAKLQELLQGKKAGDTLVFRPADIAEGDELAAFLKDPLKNVEAAESYFRFTLNRVARLIPATLDKELFEKVFPGQNITEEASFREKLREELQKEFKRVASNRLQNEIYEALVHQTPIQLPVDFLKRWMMEGQEKQKSAEEVEKEFPSFEHQLRWTLISDKIIADNNISVSQEEIMEDIKGRLLSYFGMSKEDAEEDAPWIENYLQKVTKDDKMMDDTYRQLLYQKLFSWLEEQFATTEQEIQEEEFFKLPDPHAAHHHHH